MTAGAFRCSAAADSRNDSMLGTAPPQSRLLLVHQPGAWGSRGLVESRCDVDVARRIDAAAASAGMRLQAIRRPGKHEVGIPAGGYRVGIADTAAGIPAITWWSVDDLAEVAADLERGWPQRKPIAVETAPLYLVCTHGRHDPCCALRGRPVAHALDRVRPGRVWETTHLGGDRFAANVLVLPSGELYGRMPLQLVQALVEAVDAGHVIPSQLRGRIGLPPMAQAALVYAYERLNLVERDALAVRAVRWIGSAQAEVALATPQGHYAVTVDVSVPAPTQLTCHGSANARARAYRAVSLRPYGLP